MIDYTIETSLHLMQARVDGAVRSLDLVNFITRLLKDPQSGPALKSLLIIDNDTHFEKVEAGTLQAFFHKIQESGGSGRWAIVSANGTHKALFSVALDNLAPSRVKFCVFDDEVSALRWLTSD